MLVAFREGSARIRTQPIPSDKVAKGEKGERLFLPELNLDLQEWLGALLLDREGRIVGIVGREEALSNQAAAIVIKAMPVPEEPK